MPHFRAVAVLNPRGRLAAKVTRVARTGTHTDARFWDRAARKYAASRIADMAGYERTLARTRQLLRPTDKVLELGCGTGTTALNLAPSLGALVATDAAAGMIAIAREKAAAAGCTNVTFEQASLDASLDTAVHEAGAFDAVLAFNLLHLVRDVPAALARVRRLLRPDGLFVSKTPCLGDAPALMRLAVRVLVPVAQRIGKAPYVAMLTGDALKREIAGAGFALVEEARHASKGRDIRLFLVARAP
jgi:ubiquinone/menaquinone biosynthesis C-methylase UbiE